LFAFLPVAQAGTDEARAENFYVPWTVLSTKAFYFRASIGAYHKGKLNMPKFITIGYGDREGYDRTDPAIRDVAHAHDEQLRKSGVLMGIAGTPVQVRNPGGKKVETTIGPFMSSSLPVAGFAVIEAATLADAVEMVSRSPCAVAHGIVEVWPLNEAS
jgi:hypothetical protein